MDLYRFDIMVADYLYDYIARTGDWAKAERIGERISKEIHELLNSEVWDDKWWGER